MSKKPKPPSYTPAPTLELKQTRLYAMVLRVLNQQLSVSDAARELGMPRNRFQTWMHRAQAGLIAGITKGQPGRPPEPDREQARRQEQLEEENQRLRTQLERQSELMLAAGQLMREQLQPGRTVRRGQCRTRRLVTAGGYDDDEAPECATEALARLAAGAGAGVPWRRVSAWTGRSESTLRRWRARRRAGVAVVRSAGAKRRASLAERAPEQARRVEALVVESRGVLGAEALRRVSPGVSRRDAALIKYETLTRLERERKARSTRVVITEPGVVRGFDAMHVPDSYALCACDAAVPYTTSILVRSCYDGRSVRLALERDFQDNGVPVVLRLDRYAAHSCPEVRGFLEALAVVVLQGPPHHPCFYGQLERQNRERRAWLGSLECPTQVRAPGHRDHRFHGIVITQNGAS
jgi:hypothetical protein